MTRMEDQRPFYFFFFWQNPGLLGSYLQHQPRPAIAVNHKEPQSFSETLRTRAVECYPQAWVLSPWQKMHAIYGQDNGGSATPQGHHDVHSRIC
jgi:hypothetical protein